MTCHDGHLVLRDLRIRIPSVLSVSGSLRASGGTGAELADGLDWVVGRRMIAAVDPARHGLGNLTPDRGMTLRRGHVGPPRVQGIIAL